MKRNEMVKWICTSEDNAELAERYDKWAAAYDSDLNEEFGWIGPEKTAAVFAQLVPKDAKVLDAGAGTGLVGQALSAHGYSELAAADLSQGMLDEARKKKVYSEFRQLVLGEVLEFEDSSFDSIISVGVLTLGHAPASSFDELIRITKPGGYIVFSLRTDVYETGGFKEKLESLEYRGAWALAEKSEQFQPLPKGEPDVFHQVWAYRIL